MPQFIDRRLNQHGKSLVNRQRFLRRTRAELKRAVDKAVNGREIADAANGGSITIPSRGIAEPRLQHSRQHGRHDQVLPGNKEFVAGDRIPKPDAGSGSGGKQASDGGELEDAFVFTLSQNEFLDILFEDLELPDMVKSSLKDIDDTEMYRAGFTNCGIPPNINVLRTMRNSVGRRLVLQRPSNARLQALETELAALQARDDLDIAERKRALELYDEIELLKRRQRAIPFIDPIDVRYSRFEERPAPRCKAVMFCLMDVSGSMGEHEKDLAKRFFLLLHLFLMRRYERVDIVFIRHTHTAREVGEEEFFHSQESGGTVVSTALETMLEIVRERYPSSDWNLYAAQASDGDNESRDTEKCLGLLEEGLLQLCQYYAYIEILTPDELARHGPASTAKELWRGYLRLTGRWQNFAMKHVAARSDIYPVFRELFSRHESPAKPS
jgi:hypothetical protein